MPKGNKSNNRLLLDTWRSFFLVESKRERDEGFLFYEFKKLSSKWLVRIWRYSESSITMVNCLFKNLGAICTSIFDNV